MAPMHVVIEGAPALSGGRPSSWTTLVTRVSSWRGARPTNSCGTSSCQLWKPIHAAYGAVLRPDDGLAELDRMPQRKHPYWAGSVREGRGETLTVMRLEVRPSFTRIVRSAKVIESKIDGCRATTQRTLCNSAMARSRVARRGLVTTKQYRRAVPHSRAYGGARVSLWAR